MVWAVVAVIAVLGVGPPVAGGLGDRDRERVRAAVLTGRPAGDPGLEAAVRELAAQVLARRFRTLRQAEKLGRLNLAFGPAYAAFGLVMLVIGGQGRGQTEAALGVISGAIFTLLGWHQAIHTPRRVRRKAEQIVRASQDSAPSGQ